MTYEDVSGDSDLPMKTGAPMVVAGRSLGIYANLRPRSEHDI